MPPRRAFLRAAVLFAITAVPLLSAAQPTPAPSAPTPAAAKTVILVRHAEKETGADPALTAAGRERASTLARVLEDARVSAIYVTDTVRTRATAAPLASVRRVVPIEVKVDEGYVQDQVELLRAQPAGSVSLVVSHSNKVPEIVAALGVASPPPIAGDQFDHMFVVTLPASGAPSLVHLRYGKASGG